MLARSATLTGAAAAEKPLAPTAGCRDFFSVRAAGCKLDLFLHLSVSRLIGGTYLKVLFVTTEMDDFVRVGGLAAVSAALPRALRPWSDVRIMLPGYKDVVEQFSHIEIVGECAPLAEVPACRLGRASTRDGLP